MNKIHLTIIGKWTLSLVINLGFFALWVVTYKYMSKELLLDIMYISLGIFFVAVMSWNIYEYIYKPLQLKSKLKSLRNNCKRANSVKSRTEVALATLELNIEERISSFNTEAGQMKCVELYLAQKEVLEKVLYASHVVVDSCKFQLSIFNSMNPNKNMLLRNFNINEEFHNELNTMAIDIDSEINRIAVNIDAIENSIEEFNRI